MTVSEAVTTRRTIRKFTKQRVETSQLWEIIELTRRCPCSANMQPLKYKLIDADGADKVFPYLHWAVAIAPALDPKPEERPSAYIIINADTSIRPQNYDMDVGIAAQTIALLAWERGIATCLMALHDKQGLSEALGLSENLTPALAVALGYPAQKSEIYEMTQAGYKYNLTPDGVLHVPKRPLEEILL